jgi:hypothetical protein
MCDVDSAFTVSGSFAEERVATSKAMGIFTYRWSNARAPRDDSSINVEQKY